MCALLKRRRNWCSGPEVAAMRKRLPVQARRPFQRHWLHPLTDQGGVALVVTLLIVTLVAVIVLDVNYLMRVDVHAAANFRDGVRSYYLAKGGLYFTQEVFSRNIQELEALKNILLSGGSHTLPLGDGEVTVRVVDETGKINLNALVIEAGTDEQTPQSGGQQLAAP